MKFLTTIFIVIAGFFIVRGIGGAGELPDVSTLVRSTSTPSPVAAVANSPVDLLRSTAAPATTPRAGTTPGAGTPVARGTPQAGGSSARAPAGSTASQSAAGRTTTAAAGASGVTYEVESGDTLFDIAEALGIEAGKRTEWTAAVLRVNGMASPDKLEVGQELSLPAGYSTSLKPGSSTPAGSTGQAATAGSGGTAPGQSGPRAGDSYKIAAGDTLLTIAAGLGVDPDKRDEWLDDVLALNDMDDADLLAAGESLVLPLGYTTSVASATGSGAGATGAAPATATTGETADSTIAYIVQPGDTLLQIAAKLGVGVAEEGQWTARVLRLNNMEDADFLAAGAELKVPAPAINATPEAAASAAPPESAAGATLATPAPSAQATPAPPTASVANVVYVVQAGETVAGIAAKLGVPEQARPGWISNVITMNQLTNPDGLSAGRALVLPAIDASSASANQGGTS